MMLRSRRYRLRQFAPALKHIADIIERGMQLHPELNVGLTTEGHDVRSVGNTQTLHNTALIEAFNLKAAIEYTLRNGLEDQEQEQCNQEERKREKKG